MTLELRLQRSSLGFRVGGRKLPTQQVFGVVGLWSRRQLKVLDLLPGQKKQQT
jgi:hypothetical protein